MELRLKELIPETLNRMNRLEQEKGLETILKYRDEGLKNHWYVKDHTKWFANSVFHACFKANEICDLYRQYGCNDDHITSLAIECCKRKGWIERETKKRKSAPLYEYSLCLDRVTKHPYMVEEKPVDYSVKQRLCDPTEIFRLMSAYLEEKAEEHLYMLTLNTKCQLTGVFLVGKGNVNSCVVSVRDIMTRALLAGATGIILVHNHPSGDPAPSYEDFAVSRKVATACHLMEVELLDSIVVGDGVYCSIRQENPEAIKPTEIQF